MTRQRQPRWMSVTHQHRPRWTNSGCVDLLDPDTGTLCTSIVSIGHLDAPFWSWVCGRCGVEGGAAGVDPAGAWMAFIEHERG